MVKGKILIFGASFHQQFLIKAAKRFDLEVFVVDRNPKAFARSLADHFFPIDTHDFKKIAALIKKYKISYITPGATFDAILTAVKLKDKFKLSSFLPSLKCLKIGLDKAKTRAVLEKSGVSIPKGFSTSSLKKGRELSNKLKWPVVIKPAYASGSKGTLVILSKRSFVSAFKQAQKANQRGKSDLVVVEEFIKGKILSVETITQDDQTKEVAIGEVMDFPGKYKPSIGTIVPAPISKKAEQLVFELNRKVLKAVGFDNGLTHVNIMLDRKGKPYLIDLNPRLGGGEIIWDSITRAFGVDMNNLAMQQAMGIKPKFKPKFIGKVWGSKRLMAPKKGIFKNVKWDKKNKKKFSINEIYFYITSGVQVTNEIVCTGGTLGSFTAYGTSQAEVFKNLNAFEKTLIWNID